VLRLVPIPEVDKQMRHGWVYIYDFPPASTRFEELVPTKNSVLIETLAFTDATRRRRAQTLLKKSFCDCGPVTLLREQVLGSDGLFGRDTPKFKAHLK
jgi:hypothetical protein